MEWIIDRIEEGIAVIECNGKTFNLNTEFLPVNLKEGDVLFVSSDKEAKTEKHSQTREIMDRLFKK